MKIYRFDAADRYINDPNVKLEFFDSDEVRFDRMMVSSLSITNLKFSSYETPWAAADVVKFSSLDMLTDTSPRYLIPETEILTILLFMIYRVSLNKQLTFTLCANFHTEACMYMQNKHLQKL